MSEPEQPDRTAERSAVELEWAVSGAALELENLRARVTELQRVNTEQQQVIRDLHRVTEERGELIRSLDRAISAEREDHTRALNSLEADIAEGRAIVENATAERDAQRELTETRRRAFDDDLRIARIEILRLRELLQSEKQSANRQELIDELRGICEERLLLIQDLTERLTDMRGIAAERAALLEANAEALQQVRAQVDVLLNTCEERLRSIAGLTAKVKELTEQLPSPERIDCIGEDTAAEVPGVT